LIEPGAFDFDLAVDYGQRELSLDFPALSSDKNMYANFSNQLIPVSACPQKVCKTDPAHHFSLADTYTAFDLRESYLQRHAALATQAESTYLATNDF